MEISEIRQTNLKRIIQETFGNSYAKFADRADLKPSQISRFFMSKDNKNARNIGEKTARKIEQNLDLTTGALDQPINKKSTIISATVKLPRKVAEPPKHYSKEAGAELTEEQQEWLQMFDELTPEARASLRAGLRVAHKSTK